MERKDVIASKAILIYIFLKEHEIYLFKLPTHMIAEHDRFYV